MVERGSRTEFGEKTPTTVDISEVIDTNDREDPVGLFSSKITLSNERLEGVTHYTAQFDTDFDSGKLLSLLSQIAPRSGMSQYGIVADWKMPDDAAKERTGEAEGPNQRLLRLHKTLGEDWELFDEHRQDFIDTLRVVAAEDMNVWAADALKTPEEMISYFRWKIVRSKKADGLRKQKEFKFIDKPENDEARDLIRDYMMDHPRLWRHGKIRRERALGRFKKQAPQLRYDFYSRHPDVFGKELAEVEVSDEEALTEAKRQRKFLTFPDGNEVFLTAMYRGYSLFQIDEIDEGLIVKKHGGNCGRLYIDKETGRVKVESIDNIKLVPRLQWDKDVEGNRSFVIRQDSEEENNLLGLLLLPYLEPEHRSSWRDRAGLPEGRYEQRMSEAQVPILVLKSKDAIARESEMLKRLEELSESD